MRLYPYQRDAVRKLRSGSILNGGVGSGKSITALAFYVACNGGNAESQKMLSGKHLPPLYIITTARKRDSNEWNVELSKIGIHIDDPTKSFGGASVVVDSWNNISKYVDVRGAFFIFDEQRVVGKGAWVKAFLKITKGTSNRWILLSATPGDTWLDYIPVFIANGFYKNRSAFIREHVVYDNYSKFPRVRCYMNEEKLRYYRDQILVSMSFTRRTERHYFKIPVQYDKAAYERISKDRFDPYSQTPIENVSQYCSLQRYCTNIDRSRIDAIQKIMERRERIIIFYNFNYELEILRMFKDLVGYGYGEWNGSQHDPLPTTMKWVYLVQYAAGSEGWNCTSTNTIVFYSLPYSYKQYEQACGRIDRVNTPYIDLYYYRLVSKSRIDTRIVSCIKAKKRFNMEAERADFESAIADKNS